MGIVSETSRFKFWVCSFLTFYVFVSVPVRVLDAESDVCPKADPLRPWMPSLWSQYSLCYREPQRQPAHGNASYWGNRRQNQQLSESPGFTCVKTDGVEPPEDLTSFTTSLLHERDVTHHMTWTGGFWSLGSGAYADVHLGRMVGARGQCVVVKRFVDSPLSTIEREVRLHKYIERFLPSTPRLLGLLPSGPQLCNASLVYQLVPDSETLHDWLKVSRGFSTVQWLSVALQLAQAVETLHRKCILHNDFHSANILVHFPSSEQHGDDTDCGVSRLESKKGHLKPKLYRALARVKDTTLPKVTLIDFGHATFRKGTVFEGNEESLASCRHLAPEVTRNAVTTPASDVYSLGHELQYIAQVLNISSLQDLAVQCTHPRPEIRPPAADVVHTLGGMFLNELRHRRRVSRRGATWTDVADFPSMGSSLSTLNPQTYDVKYTGGHPHRHQTSCLERSRFNTRCEPTTVGSNNLPGNFDAASSCLPGIADKALSELTLPYIPFTGDLRFQTDAGEKKVRLFDSGHTAIFVAQFGSTGELVVVKMLKKNRDYFTVRHEAMVNAYLNVTGWVPTFYGLTPLNKHDVHRLGIVQQLFADGVTLKEVLDSGRPVGVTARVDLALQLTSLLQDMHARHILINNLKSDNILCACVDDGRCSDVRLIDLGEATGCEGTRFGGEEAYLRHFPYLAPEVRRHQRTSFPSDVFSLCVVLDAVLERGALLGKRTDHKSDHADVLQFLTSWTWLSGQCFSDDVFLRPSTFQLKHFFISFLKSRHRT